MQVLLGIFFHFIGGFASGSFYIPYKKVKGWAWESYWIIGGLFSWLIIPPLAAWLTIPHFTQIISQATASSFGWTYFWGLLWGVGGLTYGLGMRYLGMSLGNSILLGFTSAFGALVPAIYYNFLYPHTWQDFVFGFSQHFMGEARAGRYYPLPGGYLPLRPGRDHERTIAIG